MGSLGGDVDGDLPHDAVVLELRYLGSLECVCGEWVADFVGCSPLLERIDELVIDTLLHVDSGSRTATLAVVEEHTEIDPGNGVFEIGIIEDDVGALATKFQRHLLQVRASGGLHDLSSDNGATGEGDLVDVHVGGHCGTGDLAEAGDDVDDAWWEAGLFDELPGHESSEWSLLGALDDDGVAAGDDGADLPCPHEEWEVPWDDLGADTDLCRSQSRACLRCSVSCLQALAWCS